MAHQRIIKPEFFTDEDVAALPPLVRLFFVGLWCQADRNGTVAERPRQLKARILPYDDMDPEAAIEALVEGRFVWRFQDTEGRRFLSIRSWKKNQNVHHSERGSGLPEPPPRPTGELPGSYPVATRDVPGSSPVAHGKPSCAPPLATATSGPVRSESESVPSPGVVPVREKPPPAFEATIPDLNLQKLTREASNADTQPMASPSLGEKLNAIWQKSRGVEYVWDFADEQALRGLLRHPVEEIARRWEIALGFQSFPRCSSIRALSQHWNAYAKPEAKKAAANGVRANVSDDDFREAMKDFKTDENGDLVL